ALRMNMMISYQELVRTFLNNAMPFLSGNKCYLTVNSCRAANDLALDLVVRHYKPGLASLFH
ncbi:hypothetical protein, partial [Klebsiella pneumoniae]|uniref:hypothetical protein n=1 Tax=Klebsiella pneumoniae TaxID=573 RepID=UPI001CB6EDA3